MISMERQRHSSEFPSFILLSLLLSCFLSFPLALSPSAEQRTRKTFRYTFFWQDTSPTPSLPPYLSCSSTPSICSSNANALHAIHEYEFLLPGKEYKLLWLSPGSHLSPQMLSTLVWVEVCLLLLSSRQIKHSETQPCSALSALLLLHISIWTQMCTKSAP